MPVIRIDMLNGRSREQKVEIVEVLTRELARIAKCTEDDVQIVINEYDRGNWAKNGKLIDATNPAK